MGVPPDYLVNPVLTGLDWAATIFDIKSFLAVGDDLRQKNESADVDNKTIQ